jgi:hypothetical protein
MNVNITGPSPRPGQTFALGRSGWPASTAFVLHRGAIDPRLARWQLAATDQKGHPDVIW